MGRNCTTAQKRRWQQRQSWHSTKLLDWWFQVFRFVAAMQLHSLARDLFQWLFYVVATCLYANFRLMSHNWLCPSLSNYIFTLISPSCLSIYKPFLLSISISTVFLLLIHPHGSSLPHLRFEIRIISIDLDRKGFARAVSWTQVCWTWKKTENAAIVQGMLAAAVKQTNRSAFIKQMIA